MEFGVRGDNHRNSAFFAAAGVWFEAAGQRHGGWSAKGLSFPGSACLTKSTAKMADDDIEKASKKTDRTISYKERFVK